MKLWLIVTQDLYCGLQCCENVIHGSTALVEKCVLECEFCSELNNTLPFWKPVLHVSVRIIIHKWKESEKAALQFTMSQGAEIMYFLNAFIQCIFQTFTIFKLELHPKKRRLDGSVVVIMTLIKAWDECLKSNMWG